MEDLVFNLLFLKKMMMPNNQQDPVSNILELFGRILAELNFLNINVNMAFSQSDLDEKEKTKKILENMTINSELNSLLYKNRANFIDMVKNSNIQLSTQQSNEESKLENADQKNVVINNKALQNTINFLNNYFKDKK